MGARSCGGLRRLRSFPQVRPDFVTAHTKEGSNSRDMLRWNQIPAEHRRVVKAEMARQLRRPSGSSDNLRNVHGRQCGAIPHELSTGIVGTARTQDVGLCHNLFMEGRKDIGSRIRGLREKCGKTQVEVSAAVGISRSHLSKIETGGDLPGRSALRLLAKLFGVTMDYLETGAEPSGPQSADQAINSLDDAWARLGRELDAEERAAVFELLERLAARPLRRPATRGRRRKS